MLIVSVSCLSKEIPKNLIYFIADGMGPAMVSGARVWYHGSKGRLHLESFPTTGFSRTYSTSDYVTDSAASGTALATGVKTYNSSISMSDEKVDSSGKSRELQTLFDIALKEGKSIGIITTARVTHATPAVFYAHSKSRKEENSIAEQVMGSGLTFLVGGGRRNFFPQGTIDPEEGKKSKRKDNRNIVQELEKNGWTYVQDKESFQKANSGKIIALFEHDHMKYELDKESDKLGEPTLSEMTKWGIDILKKNPKGYFLMIESGRIDHAAHRNLGEKMFAEVIELDRSIKTADDMTNDNDTLIVLTADHETGGLSLNGYSSSPNIKLDEFVHGVSDYENAYVSWGTGPGGKNKKQIEDSKRGKVQKALYYLKYSAHSAVDVPVVAKGQGHNLFGGFMNNSDIPRKILQAFDLNFTSSSNSISE